jgi:hypothetical protein
MTTDFPRDTASDDPTQNAANDDPFTRLEKEMTAMKNAIGDLSEQVADARAISAPSRKARPGAG